MQTELTFYEFFSGGGLARLGLGSRWRCLFANDISEKKGMAYRQNFNGATELVIDDIHNIKTSDLPGNATLAWASFPCQDLSLAGSGKGIHGDRSGTFWPFWQLILDLMDEDRKVPIVAIENVVGLLSSNKGGDFIKLCEVVAKAGYNLGAVVINADYFVPQSRPRLFIIAVQDAWPIPEELLQREAIAPWFPKALIQAYQRLPGFVAHHWVWWKLPIPTEKPSSLAAILEHEPRNVSWHSKKETQRLLSMMSDTNLEKVKSAQSKGALQVGTIYKRTRRENEKSVQRAEVRFDGVSGCLRTPVGGSSRQIMIFVEGETIRSRLLAPREAARLMGLDDGYILPKRYNDCYHLMGDAVVVPVISWLEKYILRDLVVSQGQIQRVFEYAS